MSDWSLDSLIEDIIDEPFNIMNNPNNESIGDMEVGGRAEPFTPSEHSSWCDETEEYLKSLIEKCEEESQIHNDAKVYWRQLKHGFAVPSILVSVIMTAITEQTDDWVKKSAFFTNSLLQGLSYYYDASGKMKLNAKARDEYTKILQEAQQIIALPREKRPPCRQTIDELSAQFRRTLSNAS